MEVLLEVLLEMLGDRGSSDIDPLVSFHLASYPLGQVFTSYNVIMGRPGWNNSKWNILHELTAIVGVRAMIRRN